MPAPGRRSAPGDRGLRHRRRPPAGRDALPIPDENHARAVLAPVHAMAVRTAIPATYVLVFGIVERIAGPGWAGLVSTFPSMSLVVLAVTHLEAGPAEASRIARVLPLGNTSTLAFLAAFHVTSPLIGLAGAIIAGYVAAVTVLLLIERNDRIRGHFRLMAADAAENLAGTDCPCMAGDPGGMPPGRSSPCTPPGPEPRATWCTDARGTAAGSRPGRDPGVVRDGSRRQCSTLLENVLITTTPAMIKNMPSIAGRSGTSR